MSQLTREDVESWLPDPSPTSTFGLKYQNEQERFFLWGHGLAVETGRLDELLDTSTELRLRVLSLLFTLGNVIHRVILRQDGSSSGKLAEECSNLHSQLDATSTLFEGFHQRTTDVDALSDSEISELDNEDLLDDLTTYIDCLMDLAPALEKPAMDSPETTASSAKVEEFSAANPQALIFCRKIRDMFKQLPKFLVERLGNANSSRASILSALAARLEYKAKQDKRDDSSESLFSSSCPQVTDTTGSGHPSHSVFDKVSAIRKSGGASDEADSDDGSEETFATFSTTFSTVDYGRPRVPPLPDDTRPFLCPFCGTWASGITERKAWNQAWAQHERTHPSPEVGTDKCPFCSEVHPWGTSDYFRHVSAHLREISLSVLPPRAHDDEDDASDASDDSIENLVLACSLQAAKLNLALTRNYKQRTGIPDALWESYKPLMCRLWELSDSLEEVQVFMAHHCNFIAEKHEYTLWLDKWNSMTGPFGQTAPVEDETTTKSDFLTLNDTTEKASSKADNGKAQNADSKDSKASQHRFRQLPDAQGGHEHYHEKPFMKISALSRWSMPKFTGFRTQADRQTSGLATLEQQYDKPMAICGKGSISEVQVRAKRNGNKVQVYAVKWFYHRPDESEKKYTKHITAEFSIASSLRHPNILHCADLLRGESSSNYYLIMELCSGGDLFTAISSVGIFEVLQADCFFKQLMRGVEYLHEMGVAHRDLKPENLLLSTQGALKIADFGNGECFRMVWETDAHMVSGLCGSAPYIAPEEYTDEEFDGRAVDVWACGVIYMAMRTGREQG
ncbi:serine/threonine-protein kinase HAL4/sat4 [Neonectria magnoliae]|uniref:non-specific serine/threonine protein kinase n=1 Tax=Neonectria magnoliae TaxID=2732573 RepID=A0ABR1I9D8_9HYPO